MLKLLPHLYNKDVNGKIRTWFISCTNNSYEINEGILGGSILQKTTIVPSGKNIGKKNETSSEEQALKDAESIWRTKRKDGYKSLIDLNLEQYSSLELTKDLYDILDKVLTSNKTSILDNYLPMKAQPFIKGKMTYPAIAQPKLNGIRCTCRKNKVSEGLFGDTFKVVLASKHDNLYTAPTHIIDFATTNLKFKTENIENIIYDGEIYCHGMPLEDIKSAATKYNSNTKKLQLWVFDLSIPDVKQIDRLKILETLTFIQCVEDPFVIGRVPYVIVHNDEESTNFSEICIGLGFEGVIIRDINALYRFGQRPKTMLKLKETHDKEFKIVNIACENNDPSTVLFTLQNDITEDTFESVPEGNSEQRLEYYNNRHLYIGQLATVKYRTRTKYGLPFHTNVITIRNYE